MVDRYDVIVIGAGPAGEVAAGRCSQGGLRTAIVESELVGGECSFWACMPSKGLLRPGEALAAAQRVPGAREATTGDLDVDAALGWRDQITSNWDDKYQVQWLDDVEVDLVRGRGLLAGPRRVEVESEDGRRRQLEADRAVIVATGSAPAVPPIDGLRDIRIWDNRAATSAKEVPSRLLVLGGGPVGVEMAQAWRSLGAREVTVIEALDRLLPTEEPFAGRELAAAFNDQGIAVVTGTKMVAAHREGTDGPVTARLEDGRELIADEILVAVGRRPNTRDLGLESLGLEPGKAIETDDQLRATGVDGGWLYAIGDVNGRVLLTHMGKYQGRIAADHILGRDAAAVSDHRAIPRVVFTDPQVAAVGLTEARAREAGIEARAVSYGTGNVAGASVTGLGISGTSHIVVDERRQVIVGATFTGPGVSEMLHAATIAIVGGVPLERLWHAVPSFPTITEVWLRLLETYESQGAEDE